MSVRTLADIARLAGVSRTTASYVVNGRAESHRISADTVERVQAVLAQYDFQVDAQAAALRRGATHTLGLVVPDLENASYAGLAKRLERGARQAGYQVIIVCSDDDAATERRLVDTLRARRCDGLIVASCLHQDDDFYADDAGRRGLPIIGLDRPLDEARFRSVCSSNTEAARQLTRSVLAPTTHTVLWLDAVPHLSITERRRAGFHQAMAEQEHTHRATVRTANAYDRASGARLLSDYVGEHGMPDALITAAYPLLDGALDVLLTQRDNTSTLPRIGTFGDNRVLEFLPMAVNSLPQQHDQIAEITLKRMWSALAEDCPPGRDRVERILIDRIHRTPPQARMQHNTSGTSTTDDAAFNA